MVLLQVMQTLLSWHSALHTYCFADILTTYVYASHCGSNADMLQGSLRYVSVHFWRTLSTHMVLRGTGFADQDYGHFDIHEILLQTMGSVNSRYVVRARRKKTANGQNGMAHVTKIK
jgi:hypothetical protein